MSARRLPALGGWFLARWGACCEVVDEFGAGVEAEFAIGACEVQFDGSGAEEEGGCDLTVGLAVGYVQGYLELLGGELLAVLGWFPQPKHEAPKSGAAVAAAPAVSKTPVQP